MTSPQALTLRPARSTDRAEVERLLIELDLPTAGVPAEMERFWVAEHGGVIVGVTGVEMYGEAGLLRSVAVAAEWRRGGLARTLVNQALEAVRGDGCREVFLLTTSAERYFPRLGFVVIGRDTVPEGVRASVEFRGACPDTAVVMHRKLAPISHPRTSP